ncbi:hypothetical protein FRC03_009639 [Tulasnella sp. 419]|nr:hypothetical protein FRC03_009639 [Tulasnella sp. 419]
MKQAGSSPSETIRHVMLEVCSLTCFKWGWHAEGLRFLRPLLRTQDVFALLQERKSEPTLQSPQMIVNVPNIHATSDPSPLSPSAIRLILKIIRSRLSLATSTDFNAATALILGYGRVAATNPSVPPLPQDLLGEYWAMALQFDPSGAVSTLVYIHLTAIKEWNLLRVPPMEVALAVLGNLIQAGKVASAERLIEDILQLGNIGTRCGTSPIPASVVVSPLLVEKAIQVGRHDLAQEIWRRARNRWEGYPYASICGDRRVVRALFKSLEPSLTSGVDTSFHASVLNTFVRTRPQNTQLISQLDVNVFNQCWRILRRASGQNMPKLPRMKQRRVRTAATRLRRLEASRSHNPHNVRRMYVATRTLQQRTG